MSINYIKAAFTNNLEVPIVTSSERSKMQQNETKNNRKMTEQEFLLAEHFIQNANQKSEDERRNSLNQQSEQRIQNKEISKKKEISTVQFIKDFFTKPKKEYRKIEIGSPILYTTDIKTDFITIKHQSARKEGKAYDGNFNFPKEQLYSFIYEQEDRSENILSSPLFNSTSQESLKDSRRASIMSSFSSDSFEFIKHESITSSYDEERLKNKRSISIDSGVSSLSKSSSIYDSNESLVSAISEDSVFTDSEESFSVDKKNDIVQSSFATIRKTGTGNKPIKVAIPTVPTLKPTVSDQKSTDSVEEKQTSVEGLKVLDDVSKVNGKLQREEQLLSQIEQFVPKVNISARKTTEAKVKYGTLDMLKITVEQLDLKIKAIDSLLKNKPLMKMDNNNKSEILLITKKDIPLLKKLKHDLKKELHKVNKQQSKEEKLISIREKQEQGQLQNKLLKQDIDKIENAISTAKLNVNMKERYSFLLHALGEWQTRLSKNTNAHPDLKEAIKELRKEKWAAQTNIWAIRPTEITKNYLPGSKVIDLTFEEKQDIYKHKRDTAKKLLDSEPVRGEDKEILKELYKHYTKLAKSSENKPKEKPNLEREFSKEFGPAYKQAQQDLVKVSNIHLTGDKESKAPETKMLEASIRQLTVDTVNR